MRDRRIRTVITSALVAAVLLLSFLGVALAADPTADASRTIDPQAIEPGGEVNITVEFTSLVGVPKAFALLEDIPAGWEFTRGTDDADAFKAGPPPEWAWFTVGAGATKTVTYTLTVPLDAEPGDYIIDGKVTSVNPLTENPVEGDNTITVTVVYNLTISSTAGGSVTTPGEGVFPYQNETVVDLVAGPNSGYHFVNWTGDTEEIDDPNSAETTITMNGNYSITANFEETPSPVLPTVTTSAASGISASSATLNMNYTVGDFSPVDVRFAYKKSADSAWSYTAWESKSASGTYAKSQAGLSSGTQYDFKAQLKYDETVIEGTTRQFTTESPAQPPSGGCCFATTALGTTSAKQLDVLREFRDDVLLESTAGPQFVALYYNQISPPIVNLMSANSFLKTLVRELVLDPVVWFLESTGNMWRT